MNNFLAWINRHKFGVTIMPICIFILPLLLVHCLYKWETDCVFLLSEWQAGDLIGYVAGFESFIGAIVLGIVAISQTQRANEMNERLIALQEKQNMFDRKPSVMICDWIMEQTPFQNCVSDTENVYYTCQGFSNPTLNDNVCLVTFNLVNSSNIFLEARLKRVSCKADDSVKCPFSAGGSGINPRKMAVHLPPTKTDKIRFLFDESFFGHLGGTFCCMELYLTNSIGERFIETIDFVIVANWGSYFAVELGKISINSVE